MSDRRWTHPSVVSLLRDSDETDPVAIVAARARTVALDAIENGWPGPPFDPFELAAQLGIETVPRENLEDACLVAGPEGQLRIEFNPLRRPSRTRFSVAHELGHFLFPDHDERTRYRSASHVEHARQDDWQLEMLCNVAAAEILMPAGAFPISEADDLRLAHLLDLRKLFGVSTEALLRRVLRLTGRAACMFASARLEDGSFRIDYTVPSRGWEGPTPVGQTIGPDTGMSHCTAVGFSIDDIESWPGTDDDMRVQALGIPPYPGGMYPRVIGLLMPAADTGETREGLKMLRGDATQPRHTGPAIIAHIVNDRAASWGPRGFAPALAKRFPGAREAYGEWASDSTQRRLGAVHMERVGDAVWIASMVAQAGYGERRDGRSRVRLSALARCLQTLAVLAQEHGASVHIPPIGTGQGLTPWPVVRDLLLELVVDAGVPVSVYVLEGEPMPLEEMTIPRQLALI